MTIDQEHDRPEPGSQHAAGDLLRDLLFGQHMLQDQSVGDDEHQHDGQLAGLKQGVAGVAVDTGGDQAEGFCSRLRFVPASCASGPMSR